MVKLEQHESKYVDHLILVIQATEESILNDENENYLFTLP